MGLYNPYSVVAFGVVLFWLLNSSFGKKIGDGLVSYWTLSQKQSVRKYISKGEMRQKAVEAFAAIASMVKIIEAIAVKLEVTVPRVTKVESEAKAEAKSEAKSEAKAEEEAKEEAAPLPELVPGKCQARTKDGVTQCGFKLPKGKQEPWLCGMHEPKKEAAAE